MLISSKLIVLPEARDLCKAETAPCWLVNVLDTCRTTLTSLRLHCRCPNCTGPTSRGGARTSGMRCAASKPPPGCCCWRPGLLLGLSGPSSPGSAACRLWDTASPLRPGYGLCLWLSAWLAWCCWPCCLACFPARQLPSCKSPGQQTQKRAMEHSLPHARGSQCASGMPNILSVSALYWSGPP